VIGGARADRRIAVAIPAPLSRHLRQKRNAVRLGLIASAA
jgi:hypothetical protein